MCMHKHNYSWLILSSNVHTSFKKVFHWIHTEFLPLKISARKFYMNKQKTLNFSSFFLSFKVKGLKLFYIYSIISSLLSSKNYFLKDHPEDSSNWGINLQFTWKERLHGTHFLKPAFCHMFGLDIMQRTILKFENNLVFSFCS